MLIRIDAKSPLSLSDQVAASVRRAISEGAISPGQRLPAAREVAAALNINLHTVLRGYQKLRDEGLVELRRGRGAVITAQAGAERSRLIQDIHEIIARARANGLTGEELLTLVRATLDASSSGAGRPDQGRPRIPRSQAPQSQAPR